MIFGIFSSRSDLMILRAVPVPRGPRLAVPAVWGGSYPLLPSVCGGWVLPSQEERGGGSEDRFSPAAGVLTLTPPPCLPLGRALPARYLRSLQVPPAPRERDGLFCVSELGRSVLPAGGAGRGVQVSLCRGLGGCGRVDAQGGGCSGGGFVPAAPAEESAARGERAFAVIDPRSVNYTDWV